MKRNLFLELVWSYNRFVEELREAGLYDLVDRMEFIREALKEKAVEAEKEKAVKRVEAQL